MRRIMSTPPCCPFDRDALDKLLTSVRKSYPRRKCGFRSLALNVQAAREHMEQDIEAMRDITETLTSEIKKASDRAEGYKNYLLNVLPRESLAIIFTMVAEADDLSPDPLRPQYTHPAVSISQTCSYWREIALETPRLWTDISLHRLPLKLASLCVTRSKDMLLTILADSSEKHHRAFCRTHLPRIEDLRLIGCHSNAHLQWLTAMPGPSITKICLHNDTTRNPRIMLPKLFGSNSPNLRSIRLVGIRLPWRLGLYVGLTKLSVTCDFEDDDDDDPFVIKMKRNDNDIADIFRDSPHLEEFSLSGKHEPCRPRYPPKEPIHLPHLRQLNLKLRSLVVARVLASIITPPTLCMSIDADVSRDGPRIYLCVPLPSNPLCLPSISTLRALEIDVGKHTIVGHRDHGNCSINLTVSSRTSITPCTRIVENALTLTIPVIVKWYPIPRLQSLVLRDSGDHRFDVEFVPTLLRHVQTITDLEFTACDSAIIDEFALHCSCSIVPFCPHIRSILIKEMDVTAISLRKFCESLAERLEELSLFMVTVRAETVSDAFQALKDIKRPGLNIAFGSWFVAEGTKTDEKHGVSWNANCTWVLDV